jgi:hypothetical protein
MSTDRTYSQDFPGDVYVGRVNEKGVVEWSRRPSTTVAAGAWKVIYSAEPSLVEQAARIVEEAIAEGCCAGPGSQCEHYGCDNLREIAARIRAELGSPPEEIEP